MHLIILPKVTGQGKESLKALWWKGLSGGSLAIGHDCLMNIAGSRIPFSA